MSGLWNAVPIILGLGCTAAVCVLFTRRVKLGWLCAAAAYLVIDSVVVFHAPTIAGAHWNWSGKLSSVLIALVAIPLFQLRRDEVGIRLPSGERAWVETLLGISALTGIVLALNYVFRDHTGFSREALLYQATLPGLDEELVYRGIAFALIQRAFSTAEARWSVVSPILITSCMFGLAHGYSRDNGSAHFAWFPFSYSLFVGVWLAVLRVRTRSLLGAVFAHNLANAGGLWSASLP